jgi:hypothetical protein
MRVGAAVGSTVAQPTTNNAPHNTAPNARFLVITSLSPLIGALM